MKSGSLSRIVLASALVLPACGGTSATDGGNTAQDGGVTSDLVVVPGLDGSGGAGDMAQPVGECGKPMNLAKRQALLAAQPVIEGRSKKAITSAVTWTSLDGDDKVTCSVELSFKDLDNDGKLQPFEDWMRKPAERAADLLPRLSAAEKAALLVHPVLADNPANSTTPSQATAALIDGGVRFGSSNVNAAQPIPRATWANALQERAEATPHGIPFVLSSDPAHSLGNGRTKGRGFSQWPQEMGLGAGREAALVETFGKVVAQELRAVGIAMTLSPSADLATDPRWFGSQFTFGEDAGRVGELAAAYVKGAQGATLSRSSVACVIGRYPGAGATRDGFDARLEKGRFTSYPGNNFDAHLGAFDKALEAGVAAVMPGYGIPETGAWTGAGGVLDGKTIEQVGASFNKALLTDVLRTKSKFTGLVVAPTGVLEDKGVSPLGAPWGVEKLSRAQRIGKAMDAGVDQFAGLEDAAQITAAKNAQLVTEQQIDDAATRALTLIAALGLFEDPYVDPAKAPQLTNTDDSYRAALKAQGRAMALVVNSAKPGGWLNGMGDGSQMADKGNAGNGSKKVLPAPPGEPYVAAGCAYYVAGSFDLDYVRSVSAGYGELTIDAATIKNMPTPTDADKMAASDYIFIRIAAPYSVDPDSGPFNYCKAPLEYAANDNKAVLDPLIKARAAIDSHPGSNAQIIVGVDAGRPSVVSEIMKYKPAGLYIEWGVTDKVFLDVAFGIVDGTGRLPAGLPASDAAAASQKCDVAGDGQDAVFVSGYGFDTKAF